MLVQRITRQDVSRANRLPGLFIPKVQGGEPHVFLYASSCRGDELATLAMARKLRLTPTLHMAGERHGHREGCSGGRASGAC